MSEPAIDLLLEAIRDATVGELDVVADDGVLDATVPNWRFTVRGEGGVKATLAGWFKHPGDFEELERTPLPGGELVRYTLAWQEDGVPHASHQCHVLTVRDGRIVADAVWCGGRWPASLLAEMGEAARA